MASPAAYRCEVRELDRSILPIALAAFFFAAVAIFSFTWVSQIEQPSNALVSHIPAGKRHFDLLSGSSGASGTTDPQHAGRCIGGVELDFQEEPGLVVLLKATFRGALRGVTVPARVFVGAYFNSLNQLVSANFELEVGEQTLLLSLTQPKPIRVKVAISRGGKQTPLRELDIPGPIELLSNGDGSYRLSYVALQGNSQRMIQQLSQMRVGAAVAAGAQGEMPVDIRAVDGAGDGKCGRTDELAGKEAVDLDPVLRELPSMLDTSWVSQLATSFGSAAKTQDVAEPAS